MFKAIGRKLEKIRNSDESTKRKWVIGMSSICIILIVFFWFSYIGNVIKPVSPQKNQTAENEFWPIMKNGLKLVSKQVKGKLGAMIENLLGERQIEIQK